MTGETILQEYWFEFTPNDGIEDTEVWDFGSYVINTAINENYYYRNVWNIFFDNEFPFELNKVNRVTLENFYWAYLITEMRGTMKYGRGFTSNDTISVVLEYMDGSSETIEPSATQDSDYSLDITFSFQPEKNVRRMTIIIDSPLSQYFTTTTNYFELEGYLGEMKGDSKHNFNLEIQSEEAGLLAGLIGWVQNIFNKIGEIGSAILELPSKIWSAFYNGLKDFILPSDEWLNDFFEQFKSFMQDRFGALYEINEIGLDFWNTLSMDETTETITIPATTINLGDTSFTFGGYEVDIVPDGFEWLATMIKTVVGIIAVSAFVYGFKRRFERLVGSR